MLPTNKLQTQESFTEICFNYKDKTNETATQQFHFHYETNCLCATMACDVTVIEKVKLRRR